MLSKQQQHQILEALSNDLTLFNKLNALTFKPTEKDFTGQYKIWFEGLQILKDKGFSKIDYESLKIAGYEVLIIIEDLSKDTAKLKLYNALLEFEKTVALNEIQTTVHNIEKLAAKLKEDISVNAKEKLIIEIGVLSRKHKHLNKNSNTLTMMELAETFKFELDYGVIPTYLQDLDKVINGGFERYNLSIISASPHNGKTSLAVQSAVYQALNDFKVLYISLEQIGINIWEGAVAVMAEKEAHHKGYWSKSKLKDNAEGETKRKEAIGYIQKMSKDFLSIEDGNFKTTEDLLARISLAADEGYDIVYIDNFQNLNYTGEQRIAFELFSKGLLEIAKETGLAIVALSQLTKDNAGNTKTKYASKLNDDASNHIKIERIKQEEDAPITASEVLITVEKTRRGNGFNKSFMYPFVGERGFIGTPYKRDITKEVDAERNKKLKELVNRKTQLETGLPF
jgi:KaiC/GvpD/RAD55 family RecA-like ATPase